jgi:hypothetical protein
MKSFEQMIDELPDPQQFWDDCQHALGDPRGERLLRCLLQMVPIFTSPLGATVEETHVNIGRYEPVFALFRRSQPRITASDMAPE